METVEATENYFNSSLNATIQRSSEESRQNLNKIVQINRPFLQAILRGKLLLS